MEVLSRTTTSTSTQHHGQSGFTLLELLVVIAILGVLSGGAVVAISSVRDTAQSTTCDSDAAVIETAEEAAATLGNGYLDEQGLVDAGYLREPSTLHDVTLLGSTYELVPVGACDTSGSELAEGPTTSVDDERAVDRQKAEAAAAEAAESEEAAKAAESAKAAEAAKIDEAAKAEDAATAEERAKADERAKALEAARAEEQAKAELQEKEAAASAGTCRDGQVDLNSADRKALRAIDHVGGDEATRIVKQRPFKSVEQLVEVKGLSEKDVKEIVEQGVACVG